MTKRMTKNRCGTCKYFVKKIVTDAYGDRYQVTRCASKKSDRDVTWSSRAACRCWSKKLMPLSGDYCWYIKRHIVYKEGDGIKKLPCSKCFARCIYSLHKVEKDFLQRDDHCMKYMEDVTP